MSLSEFELIGRYFSNIGSGIGSDSGTANRGTPNRGASAVGARTVDAADLGMADSGNDRSTAAGPVALGVGDDCALLNVPVGEQLAVSADTLVADVHFPLAAAADRVARRALRVNLSDLAAMGARPLGFTLALTLPAVDEAWLANFAAGLRADAEQFGIPLVGGDTTRGAQLVLTLQVMGSVPAGEALTRHGARPGDRILVSGPLGGAAAALSWLDATDLTPDQRRCLDAYWLPQPRLVLGAALRGIASAAIDISDGLAGDLGHILARSDVGAVIEAAALPLATVGAAAQKLALHGGDDYELCFTVPPGALPQATRIGRDLGLDLTEIGTITAEPGLYLAAATGVTPLTARGYRHF